VVVSFKNYLWIYLAGTHGHSFVGPYKYKIYNVSYPTDLLVNGW